MIILASTNDRLQLVTDSAASINVHATWVDTNTSTGAITPGRTNTVIAAAATTAVAGGGPASGVQRNVKTLHVRNADASLSCNVTVQHTDGTIVAQLHKRLLLPGDMLEYTDQGGFTGSAELRLPTTQTFLSGSGIYTTPAGVKWFEVRLKAGGGGGAGGGNTTLGPAATAGGNSTFGPFAAQGGQPGNVNYSGVGGSASGGLENIQGASGGPCGSGSTTTGAAGGCGGGAGGGVGIYISAGGNGAANSGGGGAGGACVADPVQPITSGGGGGEGGYCYGTIFNPAATYSYAVGPGGVAQNGAPGTGYNGGNGGSGRILVIEHYV
jgi:hypothetical protein